MGALSFSLLTDAHMNILFIPIEKLQWITQITDIHLLAED